MVTAATYRAAGAARQGGRPRSTCSPAAAPGSASAPATTRTRRARWACPAAHRRAVRAPRGHAAARAADVVGRRTPFAAATGSSARSTARRRSTRPHPPILIGGMGERRTLRARRALRRRLQPVRHPRRRRDDPPQARRARARTARRSAGPYEEIEKTVSTRLEPGESRDASPSAARPRGARARARRRDHPRAVDRGRSGARSVGARARRPPGPRVGLGLARQVVGEHLLAGGVALLEVHPVDLLEDLLRVRARRPRPSSRPRQASTQASQSMHSAGSM